MTEPEAITKKLLESFGFVVKHFSEKQEYDPANIVYMQVPFCSMRLDFALMNAEIAIEVNGDYWHGDNQKTLTTIQVKKKIADIKKERKLLAAGWRLVQFSASDLSSRSMPKRLLSSILNAFDV